MADDFWDFTARVKREVDQWPDWKVRAADDAFATPPAGVSYRMVYYLHFPFSGSRTAVAALVDLPTGVAVVMPTREPCQACLGKRGANALRALLPEIRRLDRFDRLPTSFGPHVQLSEVSEACSVPDPVGWVRKVAFEE